MKKVTIAALSLWLLSASGMIPGQGTATSTKKTSKNRPQLRGSWNRVKNTTATGGTSTAGATTTTTGKTPASAPKKAAVTSTQSAGTSTKTSTGTKATARKKPASWDRVKNQPH